MDESKGEKKNDEFLQEEADSVEQESEESKESEESEGHVVEMEAGLELNFNAKDDVIRQNPDCIKCLVVFAAFGLVSLNYIFTSLHTKSLEFVGTNIAAKDPSQQRKLPLPNYPQNVSSENLPLQRHQVDPNFPDYHQDNFRKKPSQRHHSLPDSDYTRTPSDLKMLQTPHSLSFKPGYDRDFRISSRRPDRGQHWDYGSGDQTPSIDWDAVRPRPIGDDYDYSDDINDNDRKHLLTPVGKRPPSPQGTSTLPPGFYDLFSVVPSANISLPSQPVADTYQTVYACVGVLSASLILLTEYRVVGVVGSVLTCLSCLGSTFCNTNSVNLLAFLYGALPAIGQNMIIVSATVAILENFSRRRLTALLIPHIGATIGTLVLSFLQNWLYPAIGLTSWKKYLFLQTGVAGTMILFSGLLFPARLKMRSGGTFISRLFGFNFLQVYKSPLLYYYAAIVFVCEGGLSVIIAKIASLPLTGFFQSIGLTEVIPYLQGVNSLPFFSLGQILVGLMAFTSLIGLCMNCCVDCCTSSRCVLFLLGVISTLASVLSLHASQLYKPIFAIVYSAILGIFKGLMDPFLELLVPLLLGEDNNVVGTGVMAVSKCISALTMVKLADKIESDMKKVDWCFYLAGFLFFLAIPFCYKAYGIRSTLRKGNQSESDSPPGKPETMIGDETRAPTPAGRKNTSDPDISSLHDEQCVSFAVCCRNYIPT